MSNRCGPESLHLERGLCRAEGSGRWDLGSTHQSLDAKYQGNPPGSAGKESTVIQETREMLGQSLEKEMAAHSSVLAWEIPWMEEPSMLQSKGHDWVSNTQGQVESQTQGITQGERQSGEDTGIA